MNKSESIINLCAALVKAQANIGGAVKREANSFFKSKYADLGEVIMACKSALIAEGIAVTQLVTTSENSLPALETILMHSSGEWISATMPVVCAKQHDPQALGSAVTYSRRYALQSALLIPTADDDGEAAMFRNEGGKEYYDADPHEHDTSSQRPPAGQQGAVTDFRETRLHFGKNRGLMLAELTPKQIQWYLEDWMPKKEVSGPASAEDLALVNALKAYISWQTSQRA